MCLLGSVFLDTGGGGIYPGQVCDGLLPGVSLFLYRVNTVEDGDWEGSGSLGAYMGIIHSPLPRNNGNLPLPFFGSN